MSEPEKFKRFQFSLRAAVIGMFVAGALVWLGIWHFHSRHYSSVTVVNHSLKRAVVEMQQFIDHEGTIHANNPRNVLNPNEQCMLTIKDDAGYMLLPYFEGSEPVLNNWYGILMPWDADSLLQINKEGRLERVNGREVRKP